MATAFVVWGIGLGYVYNRLFDLGKATQSDEEQPMATVSVINRRQFLMQVGAATATVTVVGAGIGLLSKPSSDSDVLGASLNAEFDPETALNLPNANDPVVAAPGTRPEYTPIENHYRIDISSGRPPRIEAESYILPITGLINNPVELTLDQIQNDYEPMHQYITMSCISNRLGGDLISTTRWTGVSMQRILELIDPKPEATHIKITAADGFDEYVALDLIREDETIMLTYAWDGAPLRQRHGFPLRIHIPNRFGMKQPKWITEMEFVDEWQEGYWVRRGWSRDAIAVTTSVIDTIAADMMIIDAENNAMHIPIGGIAWAGARSIEKVEIRIDGGEWVEAELRSPLSQKTWVVWRYEWLFEAGRHEFEVRCVDGNGDPQIESSRGTRPDGATGIHDVTVNL
jgi:DMSO/TMAO reductase YedYZ molybdopterin-dependent catalytic subunit